MKMYEKLSMDTEAALKWVIECAYRSCEVCPSIRNGLTSQCAAHYLLSEAPKPPKVPRWKTVKTQEDFDRLFAEFVNYCTHTLQCKECRLNRNTDKGMADCYHAYLSELLDAPESEVDNGEA